jgi:stage II sporulation protein D
MQRTTHILLAALAALVLAAEAGAASRFVIRGAGFGHGVGMSQYGTYGFAQHGKDHRFILAHYYRGTKLSDLGSNPTVRVLLQSGPTSFSGATNAGGRRLSASTTYYVGPTGIGRVALKTSTGRVLRTYDSPLRVTGSGAIRLNGMAGNGRANGSYRGAMLFQNTAVGAFQTVNAVGLEDYVRGVVAAESPSSWPAEALRAQAVAARTYAITTGGGPNFDQYADTRSQMYIGTAGEVPSTDAAVKATSGRVVTYNGKPVVTYFFSTSGGRTENVENAFIGSPPKPWLKSVADPYDGVSPLHRWGPYRYSMGGAAAKLGSYVKGSFRGIDVTRRGESPRVVYADVVGSGGRSRITGPQLRSIFGLRDTWATYNVITASGKVNNPASSETDPGAGSGAEAGSGPAGSDGETGGASPGRLAHAATRKQGTISGRVGWVERPTRAVLQVRTGGDWFAVATARTTRRGAFRFDGLAPGRYRVWWRGTWGAVIDLQP